MARPLALLVFACLLPWTPSGAAAGEPSPAGFQAVATVRPVEALDGDTLRLDDGQELRLAAIAAPKRPLDVGADRPWPLAEAAQAGLAERALGRDWSLVPGGIERDRYGRLLGHLVDPGGLWLNAELVAAGLVRVASSAELRLGVAPLLRAEALARERGLGLWSMPAYRVLPADEARFGLNRFALVEGQVLEVATVRGRTYLNFGTDWREDFTASLAPAVGRLFEREGIEPAGYRGLRLRVRGWVQSINGPMIEVTHPEQIEVLE